jgi:hypothetical protein
MTLWLIVWKSLRQHALSTMVTALSIALAGGLLMSVWSVKEQSQATFTGVNEGFDAVLGARGSKLQLVLNSIFHLESSPGNLAWTDYEDIAHNPNVELAVPIAVVTIITVTGWWARRWLILSRQNTRRGKSLPCNPGALSSTRRARKRWWEILWRGE